MKCVHVGLDGLRSIWVMAPKHEPDESVKNRWRALIASVENNVV